MSTFNRGLDDAFVAAFNKEYDAGGWLKGLVDDKEVFLAVRENYVNFYYRGCSLLRLDCRNGEMVGQIHYKYLLRPDAGKPYVEVRNGKPDFRDRTKNLFMCSFDDIGALKNAAKPYAVGEKSDVHGILLANPNILDVEIAFGTGGTDEAGPSAPRVDFAALDVKDEDATIVLYEAKRFDNGALRAKGDEIPAVAKQIETYSSLLQRNREAVIDSYRRVCSNFRSLRGVAGRHAERHGMLKDIVGGSRSLDLDPNPRLVVFGYDADQDVGKNWGCHKRKLRKLLNDRFLLRGKSKNFKSGISR